MIQISFGHAQEFFRPSKDILDGTLRGEFQLSYLTWDFFGFQNQQQTSEDHPHHLE
jgi:hypothetical protein